MLLEIFDGRLEPVFGALLRAGQRGMTAGDDALDHLRVRPVGRRHLAGIENAKAAGRARTDIEEPAAAPERRFGYLDGPGDFLALRVNRGRDRAIFSVDEVNDFGRGREVDVRGARIAPL